MAEMSPAEPRLWNKGKPIAGFIAHRDFKRKNDNKGGCPCFEATAPRGAFPHLATLQQPFRYLPLLLFTSLPPLSNRSHGRRGFLEATIGPLAASVGLSISFPSSLSFSLFLSFLLSHFGFAGVPNQTPASELFRHISWCLTWQERKKNGDTGVH